jgi:hypothetical protein
MTAPALDARPTAARHPELRGVTAEWEFIDLATAKAYMGQNLRNRAIKSRQRSLLLMEFISNRWVVNGATICFDSDGVLTDGQHRLQAYIAYALKMIASGKSAHPMVTLVVRGLPPKARETTDTNAVRSASDSARIDAVPYATLSTSIVKHAIAYEGSAGEWLAGSSSTKVPYTAVRAALIGGDEAPATHPEILDIAACTARICGENRTEVRPLQPNIAGYCLWLFSFTDMATAKAFIERIYDGSGITAGDPIYAFRRRMTQAVREYEKLTPLDVLAFLITTWNKWQIREPASKLQRPRGRGDGERSGHHTLADVPLVYWGRPRREEDGRLPQSPCYIPKAPFRTEW